MADSNLLVAGTGGTKLLKNGVDIGYPVFLQGRVDLLEELGLGLEGIVQLLSMAHQPGQIPPSRTTLVPGAAIDPGPVLALAYNQLPAEMLPFRYDWRADLRYSAQMLLDWLQTRKPSTGRWRLVSHSQGGLVVLVASKLCADLNGGDPEAFSRLVAKSVFVGVPVYGTLNAAHALVVGDQLGAGASPAFQRIAPTWPALYQMLPDWRGALQTPNGQATPFSFLNSETWKAYPGISADLLARGLDIKQNYLRDPLACMAGVGCAFIMARNNKTWDHAVQAADGTISFPARTADGDSLVPFEKTVGRMTPAEHECVHQLEATALVSEHAMLLDDPVVATLTLKLLSDS